MGVMQWDEEIGLWNRADLASILALLMPHRAPWTSSWPLWQPLLYLEASLSYLEEGGEERWRYGLRPAQPFAWHTVRAQDMAAAVTLQQGVTMWPQEETPLPFHPSASPSPFPKESSEKAPEWVAVGKPHFKQTWHEELGVTAQSTISLTASLTSTGACLIPES